MKHHISESDPDVGRPDKPGHLVPEHDIRRIADAPAVNVEAHNPRQALRMLAQQFPKLVPDVLTPDGLAEHWRLSLGGKRFLTDLDLPLETGDDLVLVSALAGG